MHRCMCGVGVLTVPGRGLAGVTSKLAAAFALALVEFDFYCDNTN